MTQTGVTNAIVNVMVGWLKGVAGWVLKLFNLAGSGGSPLLWLSQNWFKLLILLLVAGVAIDRVVWMIRWRPYWVWMRKKRIIVNDARMLEDEEDLSEDDAERRYVVPSTVVHRDGRARPAQPRQPAVEHHRRVQPVETRRPSHRRISNDVLSDELFEVGHDREDVSDFYEDEVFNVSSLPQAQTPKKAKKRHR